MLKFIVCVLAFGSLAYGDIIEECNGIESMYIAAPDDCSYYIFCHDEDSFRDACPDDNPYFSPDDQTCDVAVTVCGDRPYVKSDDSSVTTINPTDIPVTTTINPTNIPVTTINPTNIPVTTTINPTNLPVTTINPTNIPLTTTINPTNLPVTTTINPTNIPVTTINPTNIPVTTNTPFTIIPLQCPSIDNPNKAVFLPNTKSCSDYYLCYHGQPLPMYCSHMLHFDMKQQKCDYPENVHCQMDTVSPRDQCTPHTFDVFPHTHNCNYYYLCSFGYLMVMQCPIKMGWDYEKRSCTLLSQAKCYNSMHRV